MPNYNRKIMGERIRARGYVDQGMLERTGPIAAFLDDPTLLPKAPPSRPRLPDGSDAA